MHVLQPLEGPRPLLTIVVADELHERFDVKSCGLYDVCLEQRREHILA